MLAESFRDAGYATAGFASHIYLAREYGFDRGFGTFEVVPDERAMKNTEKAIRWLDTEGRTPFFLFLHYFDPHWDFPSITYGGYCSTPRLVCQHNVSGGLGSD